MKVERRSLIIITLEIQQPEMERLMEKGKSFEISQEEVEDAYEEVKANKGAGGVDKVSIAEFEEKRRGNLYKIWNRMSSGSYFPKPVKGVEIPKKDGKKRLLGIPTVEDRIAQTVVKNRLEPLVEPHFLQDSYGYRPGKSALDALDAARERCFKTPWVLEFDIKGLFDTIDHELLMKAVAHHTDEKWVLLYIERSLVAPLQKPDGTIQERNVGTPQGGVISAVLANLFMHYAFDLWMAREFPSCAWERYADDGIVHCVTLKQAQYVLKKLEARMRECKLELHPEKTRIVYCKSQRNSGSHENESFDFLGYTFKARSCKGKDGKYFIAFSPALSKAAAKSLREKVRTVCRNAKTWSIKELAEKINQIVRGWYNYFSKYRKSEATKELRYINFAVMRWYKRTHKKAKRSMKKAFRYLVTTARYKPGLFYHWFFGFKPTMMIRAV